MNRAVDYDFKAKREYDKGSTYDVRLSRPVNVFTPKPIEKRIEQSPARVEEYVQQIKEGGGRRSAISTQDYDAKSASQAPKPKKA